MTEYSLLKGTFCNIFNFKRNKNENKNTPLPAQYRAKG
jgi:hypothetical protein